MFIWTTEIACVCFMVIIQKLKKVRSFLKLLKFFLKDGKAIDNSKVPGKEPGTHITSMPRLSLSPTKLSYNSSVPARLSPVRRPGLLILELSGTSSAM